MLSFQVGGFFCLVKDTAFLKTIYLSSKSILFIVEVLILELMCLSSVVFLYLMLRTRFPSKFVSSFGPVPQKMFKILTVTLKTASLMMG